MLYLTLLPRRPYASDHDEGVCKNLAHCQIVCDFFLIQKIWSLKIFILLYVIKCLFEIYHCISVNNNWSCLLMIRLWIYTQCNKTWIDFLCLFTGFSNKNIYIKQSNVPVHNMCASYMQCIYTWNDFAKKNALNSFLTMWT